MTKQEHISRHEELRAHLDELIADYIDCQSLDGKTLADTNLMEFIEWSHKQTLDPSGPRQ